MNVEKTFVIYIKQQPNHPESKLRQQPSSSKRQNYILIFILIGLIVFTGSYLGKNLLASIIRNRQDQYQNSDENIEYVTAADLKDLINKNPNILLLDVRANDDYEWEHIENSLNIPLNQLSLHYNEFNKNQEIITICDDSECEYSYIAARRLKNEGYTNVKVLEDGIPSWKIAEFITVKSNEALELEKSLKVQPINPDELDNILESEKNILILDLRDRNEYLKSHINTASWIDKAEFDKAITVLPREKKIILITTYEKDAFTYGALLTDNGFIETRYLKD